VAVPPVLVAPVDVSPATVVPELAVTVQFLVPEALTQVICPDTPAAVDGCCTPLNERDSFLGRITEATAEAAIKTNPSSDNLRMADFFIPYSLTEMNKSLNNSCIRNLSVFTAVILQPNINSCAA
jgi:hypothetical protein